MAPYLLIGPVYTQWPIYTFYLMKHVCFLHSHFPAIPFSMNKARKRGKIVILSLYSEKYLQYEDADNTVHMTVRHLEFKLDIDIKW